MPGSEINILGKPSYRFLQRFSVSGNSGAFAVPVGYSTFSSFFTLLGTPGIGQKQAFRVIAGWVQVNTAGVEPAANTSLVIANFVATILDNTTGTIIRAYPCPSANTPIGRAGPFVRIDDSDFVLASDYGENGGIAGHPINVVVSGDIQNTTAGAINVQALVSAIAEIYQADTLGAFAPTGQQALGYK
jgi:hypothetical protein